MVLIGLATLTGALIIAGWYGERLARALGTLANHAKRVGEGEVLVPAVTSVREINEVEQTLSRASVDLSKRAKALQENEQRLRLALEAGKMHAWDWDLVGGLVHMDAGGLELWGAEPTPGALPIETFFSVVDSRDVAKLRNTLEGVIAAHKPYSHEFRIKPGNGAVRWLAGRGLVLGDIEGKPTRMIGVNFDVTATKDAEKRTALLIAELNHRVKNSLAVLQAIANRTMSDAPSPEAFVETFTGRLMALEVSHSLLSESGWQGTDLMHLIANQTGPYSGNSKERIRCNGPIVRLGSDLSLAFGFVLHELTANAAKYGALSVPEGRLEVTWDLIKRDEHETLEFSWIERGGPSVQAPTRKGFGSKLIDESLAYAFKGKVTRSFEPAGMTAHISVSLE